MRHPPTSVRRSSALALSVLAFAAGSAAAQPVSIPRVEAMPRVPTRYRVPDWKGIARAYDALVFDVARTGTHLPLTWVYGGTTNYPAHPSFGMSTYVGDGRSRSGPGEAINQLPALVGATLVGIDKRAQAGRDWVLYAEEFFNRRPAENVYLNGTRAASGGDWWYDTMPNVFFLQLVGLYGDGVGDFRAQVRTVADRWLAAVGALGGRAAPYAAATFDYRAFALATMRPNASGVHEPEAAGAIAWVLYHAYRHTGDDRYRLGAEQALDFLQTWTANPSYELQLPYGALTAARMNAELGTRYDVAKLVNWTFDRGALRGWGTIVGGRGGYGLDGLVGEVDGDFYAFGLNGFQQAAALVPLVRYDDRFARAIGRWMTNVASNSRLFYRPFLPDANQDAGGLAWSRANDPAGVIPYEALRGARGPGGTPFATGDNFAATNLSLYSGSSVGYLAALVDTTDVPAVLRLDLRATDFFGSEGYPTSLVYNPHTDARTVTLPLPAGTHDLYDAAADVFVTRGATGTARVEIPPDAARVLVVTPTGGAAETRDGRLLVDGRVVDYRVAGNRPPRVKSFATATPVVGRNENATLYCLGDDPEDAAPLYGFTASGGNLRGFGTARTFSAAEPGTYGIACTVTDAAGRTAADTLTVTVVANRAPFVAAVTATPAVVEPGGTAALACAATDGDGDAVTYAWTAARGAITPNGAAATFTAPTAPGYADVRCTASDPSGAAGIDSARVAVGTFVLHLPLDAPAVADASGYGHGAFAEGAGPVAGGFRFDGVDDRVEVPVEAAPALTAEGPVTVAFWTTADAVLPREQFLVSHGSYRDRYKVSLYPQDGRLRLRWTVKSSAGIADLDAAAPLSVGARTHVAVTFGDGSMRVYVNGTLSAERVFAGTLGATTAPFLLGQILPGDTGYNFPGVLADVRVYRRVVTAAEVATLAGTVAADPNGPGALRVRPPAPNPAAGPVTFGLALGAAGPVHAAVYDGLGRRVALLADGVRAAGDHALVWDGAGASAGLYWVRVEAGGEVRSFPVVRVR